MSRVLVTGGTGTLGRELVPRLTAAGYTVRVMSRRAGQSNHLGDVEWAQADLMSGAGIEQAVAGVDIILHAASSPFKDTRVVDVDGTRNLINSGEAAGVGNFYYMSIVGIDKVKYPYYAHKLEAENVIEASGAPFTILRATQFHPLLDTFLSTMYKRGPFLIVPGAMLFQLIDPGEVAEHVVASLAKGAGGRLPDIGGPQVLRLSEIARDWLKAGRRRLDQDSGPRRRPSERLRSRIQLLPGEQYRQNHVARLAGETLSGRKLVSVTLRRAANFPL
jgi:uncharacterized protein YbjT (DUF2867 family)